MVPANALLDLDPGIGQVASTFRWDVVDDAGGVGGQIHPEVNPTPTMTNDTRSAVFRTVRNVRIRASEFQDLDPYRDRIQPSMVLQDGTSWPLGVFVVSVPSTPEGSVESTTVATLLDRRHQLGQNMPHSYAVPNGGSVYDAMVEVAGFYGLAAGKIEPNFTRVSGGPANWPPDAVGTAVMESLAQRSGYFPPYFDNAGALILRPLDALLPGVGHRYDRSQGRIVVGTLVPSANLLDAPNIFRVIGSGPTSGEVYAEARVDPGQRNSVERTGREVIRVVRKQGLGNRDACLAVAQSLAAASASQYATAEFTGPPDPRHDTFDIVQIDDDVYREVGWSLEMRPGGAHSHTLVKSAVRDG